MTSGDHVTGLSVGRPHSRAELRVVAESGLVVYHQELDKSDNIEAIGEEIPYPTITFGGCQLPEMIHDL